MVDMTMGDTDSDDLFPTTVGEVWDRTVDTILVLISELETHIDDDHLIFVFESHTVETDLLRSTKWDDAEGASLEWFWSLFGDMEEFFHRLNRSEKRKRFFWTK
jgi:hypothetical protein